MKNDNVIDMTMAEAIQKYNTTFKKEQTQLTKSQVEALVSQEFHGYNINVRLLPRTGLQVWMTVAEEIHVLHINYNRLTA